MPMYTFKALPTGTEVRAYALEEDTAQRIALQRLPAEESGAVTSLELVNIEPLACSPMAPVIDRYEDGKGEGKA